MNFEPLNGKFIYIFVTNQGNNSHQNNFKLALQRYLFNIVEYIYEIDILAYLLRHPLGVDYRRIIPETREVDRKQSKFIISQIREKCYRNAKSDFYMF